jgi:hypothetical protein
MTALMMLTLALVLLQLAQWLPAARALSPAEIAAKIQPSAAAVGQGTMATLSTFSLYSYYHEVEFDAEKAARAGPLLKKAAARTGEGFLEEVLKQLAKKKGKPARRFFLEFANKIAGECIALPGCVWWLCFSHAFERSSISFFGLYHFSHPTPHRFVACMPGPHYIAGETDIGALEELASAAEARLMREPAEPHWHVARAVLRLLVVIRNPGEFMGFVMAREVPRELTMAMELV